MDSKARGIVLKSSDYKDNDKIIRLYTLEQGKLSAVMRGVKKHGAKLKIPSQVFCFGEYLLNGRLDGFPVVTGCTVEESFFSLAADTDKFAAAAVVMEIMEKALPDGESNPPVFIQALKTMKELLKATTQGDATQGDGGRVLSRQHTPPSPCVEVILLNFMLSFFRLSGYNLKLEKCAVCGEKSLAERCFDFGAGGAVCRRCASSDAVKISPFASGVMLAAGNCETDRLGTLNLALKGVEEGLSLCKRIAERIFEIKLLSI